MWSRLDDELLDHPKLYAAGDALGKGKDGTGLALALYAASLMWSNKYLTDGHLPASVVKTFRHFAKPLTVADALVKAGLFEKNGNGFLIHDFKDFNPAAMTVRARQRRDRRRKALERKEKRES